MAEIEKLYAYMEDRRIGVFTKSGDGLTTFEYADECSASLSLSLPHGKKTSPEAAGAK